MSSDDDRDSKADGGTEMASNDWQVDAEETPTEEQREEPTFDPPESGSGPEPSGGGTAADEEVDPYEPPESQLDPSADPLEADKADVAIYSSQGIGVATFLGGPIAAVALMTYNFHKVGWEERVMPTLVIGLLLSGLVVGIGYALPAGTTGMGIGALAGAVIASKKLNAQIEERLGAEPQAISNWNAAGFGCLSFIATVVVIFGLVFVFGV